MKNLVLTFLIVCASLCYAQISQLEPVEKENKHFFVGIVVDSSPATDKAWNIRKSRAIELISNLEQGDKVVVLKARPGSPSVDGKTTIGGPQKTGSNEIVSQVSVLKKELLSSADVARACESIYDIFVSEGNKYKCLLVVLTSGKFNNNQAQRIIETSSQIKTLGGSTSLTYNPAVANQNIIAAGKKNDFDILLESNPDLAGWIKSKREVIEPEKIVIEKTEYVFVKPDLAPLTTMIDKALTSLKSDVDTPKPSRTPELPLVSQIPAIDTAIALEPDDISTSNIPDTNTPADIRAISPETCKLPTRPRHGLLWILIAFATIVLMAALLAATRHTKRKKMAAKDPKNTEEPPSHLKAIFGEQDVDLGDVNLISELTLGSDPGCSIFIDDDQLSPQCARIFNSRENFKLQNLDPEPVFVNGLEVRNKKKVRLDLPADIQLPNGMTLNLYTEILPETKEGNHE